MMLTKPKEFVIIQIPYPLHIRVRLCIFILVLCIYQQITLLQYSAVIDVLTSQSRALYHVIDLFYCYNFPFY